MAHHFTPSCMLGCHETFIVSIGCISSPLCWKCRMKYCDILSFICMIARNATNMESCLLIRLQEILYARNLQSIVIFKLPLLPSHTLPPLLPLPNTTLLIAHLRHDSLSQFITIHQCHIRTLIYSL